MNIFIISGLSGSGKTVALHALEDEGFYCIDNLPVGLLPQVVDHLEQSPTHTNERVALGVDARSGTDDLKQFSNVLKTIKSKGHEATVIYLHSETQVLLKRFSETRRKHPLSHDDLTLSEAIEEETKLLSPVRIEASLSIDTTSLNIHELNLLLRERIDKEPGQKALSLLIQSFGFKHGIPLDSDFMFDLRCLPNPYWEPRLRKHTGLEEPIVEYLEQYADVTRMYDSLQGFMDQWVPLFSSCNRSYMTVSIGCTGGRHRSVYMAEKLGQYLKSTYGDSVKIRHRDVKH